MACYVIALHMDGKEVAGYRIIDTINLKYLDYTVSALIRAMASSNLKIDNLVLNNKKLVLGASVDRFPMLSNGTCYNNQYKATVIGYQQAIGGGNIYSLMNYDGRVVKMDEYKLIQYGEKYGLTNGKVVTKGDTKFVASLHGSFRNMLVRPKFRYLANKESRIKPCLYIEIPLGFSGDLEIPEMDSYGVAVEAIQDAVVFPDSEALNVKRLTFPKSVYKITDTWAKTFPNLKEVRVTSFSTTLTKGAFANSKIESFRASTRVNGISDFAFKGCRNLKSIISPLGIPSIGEESFSGCVNLNIQSILDQSVGRIETKAFTGCKVESGKLVLKDTSSFNYDTFDLIDNLQILRLDNPTVNMQDASAEKGKLYRSSKVIELYPNNRIIKNIHPDVIIEYLPGKGDERIALFIERCNLAGIDIDLTDGISDPVKANMVLRIVDSVKLRESLRKFVLCILLGSYMRGTLRLGAFNITTVLDKCNSREMEISQLKETESGLAIQTAKNWIILPYDKRFLREDNVSYTNDNNRVYYGCGLLLNLRTFRDAGKVDDISMNEDGAMVVTMRSGKQHIYYPGKPDGVWGYK